MGRCGAEYTQYTLKIDKTARKVVLFFLSSTPRSPLAHLHILLRIFSPHQLPRTHFHFSFFSPPLPPLARVTPALTEAGDERPVESAVRVQLAALGRSLAARPLHEELVLGEAALLGAIQRRTLLLEGTAAGLLRVRLPLGRDERGAVFGLGARESPERVGLVIPTLRGGRAII